MSERDVLAEVTQKCEQYWNESGIGDAEIHAILSFIYTRAKEAAAEIAALRERVRVLEDDEGWVRRTPEAPPEFTKLPKHATGGANCWHGHGVAVTALYCERTRGFERFEVYRRGELLSPVSGAVNFIGWDAVVAAALRLPTTLEGAGGQYAHNPALRGEPDE